MAHGLFVGLCTRDIIYYIDEYPKENHKVKTAEYDTYIGGPAANAAITYAALGGKATLATCLGNTQEAANIIAELEHYGVKVMNCATDSLMPDVAAITVTPEGARTIFSGQHVFSDICIPDMRETYDFVLFDLNRTEISLKILEHFQDTCVIIDAGSWKEHTEEFLRRADIVIASEYFCNPEGDSPFDMAICEQAQVAVTRGEQSILYGEQSIEVPQVQVVDTLGAGDIFHGAFCYGYHDLALSMQDALAYAAGIASDSVRYKGPRNWIMERANHTECNR